MPISDECRKQIEVLVPENLRLAPLASSAMYSLMPSPWNDGTDVDMILGGRCDRGERKGENRTATYGHHWQKERIIDE